MVRIDEKLGFPGIFCEEKIAVPDHAILRSPHVSKGSRSFVSKTRIAVTDPALIDFVRLLIRNRRRRVYDTLSSSVSLN